DEQRTARTFQPVVQQTTTLPSPVFVPFFTTGGDFDGLLLTGIPGTEMAVLSLPDPPKIEDLPVKRIEADGTLTAAVFGVAIRPVSILRVWDKTHNLLSELFQVPSTPVIGPNPTNTKVPAAGDSTVHVYGRLGDKVEVFLLERSTDTFHQIPKTETITLDDDD